MSASQPLPYNPLASTVTERIITASPQEIFAVFEDAESLAKWWGPSGFTNTFETFEFKPEGNWVYTMHDANGFKYPNKSVFREVVPAAKIVIEHVVRPWYRLTVTLEAQGNNTRLTWVQEFESQKVADKLRHVVEPSNEQNLDRLEAILAGKEII